MAPEVLVVEETASLAGSLVALLEADGIAVRRFEDLAHAERVSPAGPATRRLVLVASNGHYCPSASRWALGPLRELPLVVVGTRDPALRSAGRLHVVRLPLEPERLLALVHGLLETGTASGLPR